MVGENKSKRAFWQALVFTIIIFGVGLIVGYFFEVNQSDAVFSKLIDAEINILDDQTRNRIIRDFGVECPLAKESLFGFADKIYEEALDFEEFSSKGNLKDFSVLHKRYDILRTLLWLESNYLKEKCDEDFNVIVYLYEYNSEDIDVNSRQILYSRLLLDLKEARDKEIVLIPIAVNTGLSSVELMVKSKEIEEFPSILINDETVLKGVFTFEELEGAVFG